MTIYNGGAWSDDVSCNVDTTFTKEAVCEMPVPTVPVYHTQIDHNRRVSQYCPIKHVIDNLAVEGVVACGWACTSDPQCRSFNVWQRSEKEKKCQLNDVTRLENDQTDSHDVEGCVYFNL